jgi:hypothetical protein
MSASSKSSAVGNQVERDGYLASKGSDVVSEDPDAEFGGKEARAIIEKKLLWKIDVRYDDDFFKRASSF